MATRGALQQFVEASQERMRQPVASYYRVVQQFGPDSMQATVAQSITRAELERTLRSIHTQAAVLGNAGALDVDAKGVLKNILEQDTYYLNNFVRDMPRLTEGQSLFRAGQYVDTAKGTVSDIATMSLPTLSVYPRDSSLICSWHCKCALDVRYLFGAGNYDVYWQLDQNGGVEHCDSCLQLSATWRPLQIRAGVIKSAKSISAHDFAHLKVALLRMAA